MSEKQTYYITTPIYYPSAKLHIGNAYTTVVTDIMARYKKLRGYDVKYATGMDEHGQKIERAAAENNKKPQVYLDEMAEWIKNLWNIMDIEYDFFVRTTDKEHTDTVKKVVNKLFEKGDIYKGSYEGYYCISCETFYTETQLDDGKCPDCGKDVELAKEDCYFFKVSKYQDRLMKHIEENPEFIMPVYRKNEMVNNFLKPGLTDLAITRTSFGWGIPADFDPKHVIYVWVDALLNYVSVLGFMSEDDSLYKKYWPADVHVMAKEIVRFHSILWPIMLMALDEPLPKQIYAHGWLTFNGEKMSKSKGNGADPIYLSEKFTPDAIRYFLAREFVFGNDGDFSTRALLTRINSDLANDFGNLLSRTVGMIDKYFDGKLPEEHEETEFDADLKETAIWAVKRYSEKMDKMIFNDALKDVWTLVSRTNKYIDETTPWILAKEDDKQKRLAGVLYNLSEVLRILAVLIAPVMPNVPEEIHKQLNITDDNLKTWESIQEYGKLPKEVVITKGNVIFPRLDIEKELEELDKLNEEKEKEETKEEDLITIDDFAKVKLKVGKVLECEKMKDSKKLVKSQIKVGEETRQIVSGIADFYSPEEMVGKYVIVVTNLKPVKIRGVLSQGMILAASDNKNELAIVTVDKDIDDGTEVS